MAFPSRTTRRGGAVVLAAAALALTACSAAPAASAPESADAGSAAVAPPAIQKAGVLSACVISSSPPNAFAEEDGTNVGAEIEIAAAVAAELGLTINYAEYAFSGMMPALQAKQCDVIMSSLYIKPEREEVVDFVPYLRSGSAVAVAKDNPKKITGFDDSLCGTKVLAITGATGALNAEERSAECVAGGKKALDITLSDQGPTALQQVTSGQVDAFLDTAEIVGYYQKLSDDAFVLVGEPFGTIDIGAATLKGNDALHEALQTAFDAVIASGEYESILETWGLSAQNITS